MHIYTHFYLDLKTLAIFSVFPAVSWLLPRRNRYFLNIETIHENLTSPIPYYSHLTNWPFYRTHPVPQRASGNSYSLCRRFIFLGAFCDEHPGQIHLRLPTSIFFGKLILTLIHRAILPHPHRYYPVPRCSLFRVKVSFFQVIRAPLFHSNMIMMFGLSREVKMHKRRNGKSNGN